MHTLDTKSSTLILKPVQFISLHEPQARNKEILTPKSKEVLNPCFPNPQRLSLKPNSEFSGLGLVSVPPYISMSSVKNTALRLQVYK